MNIFERFLHPEIRFLHIAAGIVAIIAGFIALYSAKGAPVHRRVGLFFVYALIVNAAAGTVLALVKVNLGNMLGGSMSLYMVTTALLTTRRRVARLDLGLMLLGLAVVGASYTFGFLAMRSATGTLDKYPAQLYFMFGSIALLSVAGDVRMIVVRGLSGRHRLVRHLWRMCAAMFIASQSFFLGQAKLLPAEFRIIPLLAIPVVIVLALGVYWALRVTFSRHYPARA
jgi:uncharacterized membrane protein